MTSGGSFATNQIRWIERGFLEIRGFHRKKKQLGSDYLELFIINLQACYSKNENSLGAWKYARTEERSIEWAILRQKKVICSLLSSDKKNVYVTKEFTIFSRSLSLCFPCLNVFKTKSIILSFCHNSMKLKNYRLVSICFHVQVSSLDVAWKLQLKICC